MQSIKKKKKIHFAYIFENVNMHLRGGYWWPLVVEYYACDRSPRVVCVIQAPRAFRATERKRGAKATLAKFDSGRGGRISKRIHRQQSPRSACS